MLVLLVLACVLAPASRAASPLTDARPHLVADSLPLAWWDGGPAYLLASARGVRINFRGVFPLRSHLRGSLEAVGWTKTMCNESAFALCSSDTGAAFPASSPRVADAPRRLPDGWRGLSCRQSAEKVLVRALEYDISACDVLDEDLDVLYTNGTLYFRQADLPEWEHVASIVLCIVITRALSFNVQSLLNPAAPVQIQAPGLVATAIILVFVGRDGDRPYVTVDDLVFFYVSVAFVGAYVALYTAEYLARWGKRAQAADPFAHRSPPLQEDTDPFFTLLIGGLQLAIMRFYRTVDSPYAAVLLGMLVARLWIKVRAIRLPLFAPGARSGRWALTSCATLLLDSMYVAFYTSVVARALGHLLIAIYAAGWVFSDVVDSHSDLMLVKDGGASGSAGPLHGHRPA